MNESSILLISHCPTLIEHVRGVASTVPHTQVEVCSAQNAVRRARQADVSLILAHTAAAEEAATVQIMWSVAQAKRPCPTIVLRANRESRQAAALLRAGAAADVAVPDELQRLNYLLQVLHLRHRLAPSPAATSDNNLPDALVGDGLGRLAEQVRRVAPQETTVLLTGETGAGKTRLGRLIHDLSPRRNEPFLVVDCGSLSAGLIESELFGHARGAFTGADRDRQGKLAAAGCGTLLLDEVNSLPLPLQSKLLRAVDERQPSRRAGSSSARGCAVSDSRWRRGRDRRG